MSIFVIEPLKTSINWCRGSCVGLYAWDRHILNSLMLFSDFNREIWEVISKETVISMIESFKTNMNRSMPITHFFVYKKPSVLKFLKKSWIWALKVSCFFLGSLSLLIELKISKNMEVRKFREKESGRIFVPQWVEISINADLERFNHKNPLQLTIKSDNYCKILICEYLMYKIQGKCLSIDPCSSWGTQSQKSLSFLIFGKIIPRNDPCSQGAWKLLFSFKLVSILCINPRRVSRHRFMQVLRVQLQRAWVFELTAPLPPIRPLTFSSWGKCLETTARHLICVYLMYKNSRKVPKHRLELVF